MLHFSDFIGSNPTFTNLSWHLKPIFAYSWQRARLNSALILEQLFIFHKGLNLDSILYFLAECCLGRFFFAHAC